MTAEVFNFAGIANAEARDREDEARSGVPAQGNGSILISVPAKYTSKVGAMVVSDNPAHVRVRHQGATKPNAGEPLIALKQGATDNYSGKLEFKSVVRGTVSITNSNGAIPTVVDDVTVAGLWDTGFVGVAGHARGSIDYQNGILALAYGGAASKPVAAYSHTDATDFVSPTQTSTKAAAAFPFSFQLGFGRVNPGSVAITEGTPLTFVDDGKGNIIETTGGIAVVVGTIDYATGLVTLTAATSAPLAGTVTATFTFNPFATLLAGGGGQKAIELFPGAIPEFSAAAWAAGIKTDTRVVLWGEGRSSMGSALIAKFAHFGDQPYLLTEDFSGFPPGGASNDTRQL